MIQSGQYCTNLNQLLVQELPPANAAIQLLNRLIIYGRWLVEQIYRGLKKTWSGAYRILEQKH